MRGFLISNVALSLNYVVRPFQFQPQGASCLKPTYFSRKPNEYWQDANLKIHSEGIKELLAVTIFLFFLKIEYKIF